MPMLVIQLNKKSFHLNNHVQNLNYKDNLKVLDEMDNIFTKVEFKKIFGYHESDW